MFGRKKPEDQSRAAVPAGAANGQTRRTPSFGSAGSLSLRKAAADGPSDAHKDAGNMLRADAGDMPRA